MIDFRDVPEFAQLAEPDTSHIDAEDVPRFTIAMAQLLKKMHLADQSSACGSETVPKGAGALPAVEPDAGH